MVGPLQPPAAIVAPEVDGAQVTRSPRSPGSNWQYAEMMKNLTFLSQKNPTHSEIRSALSRGWIFSWSAGLFPLTNYQLLLPIPRDDSPSQAAVGPHTLMHEPTLSRLLLMQCVRVCRVVPVDHNGPQVFALAASTSTHFRKHTIPSTNTILYERT